MKKLYSAIFAIIIIALLTITACGGNPSASTAKEEPAAATTVENVEPEEETEAEDIEAADSEAEETETEETVPENNFPELTAEGIVDDGQTYVRFENEVMSIEFPDSWTVDTSIIANTRWISGIYRFDNGYMGIEISKTSWGETTVQNTARMLYENYQYTEDRVNCYPAALQGRKSYVIDSFDNNTIGRSIYSSTPDGEQFIINIAYFNQGIVFEDFDYSGIESEMNHALNTLSFK